MIDQVYLFSVRKLLSWRNIIICIKIRSRTIHPLQVYHQLSQWIWVFPRESILIIKRLILNEEETRHWSEHICLKNHLISSISNYLRERRRRSFCPALCVICTCFYCLLLAVFLASFLIPSANKNNPTKATSTTSTTTTSTTTTSATTSMCLV